MHLKEFEDTEVVSLRTPEGGEAIFLKLVDMLFKSEL